MTLEAHKDGARSEGQAPTKTPRLGKHSCVVCKEKKATLQLNETDWICEDCAQHMSDLAPRD